MPTTQQEKERKTKRKQSDFLGELAEWRIQCIKRWRRTSIYYPHTHTHTRPVFVLPTKGRGSHKKTPQKYFLPPPPKKRGDIINLEEKKTYFYFPLLNDEIVPKKKKEKKVFGSNATTKKKRKIIIQHVGMI